MRNHHPRRLHLAQYGSARLPVDVQDRGRRLVTRSLRRPEHGYRDEIATAKGEARAVARKDTHLPRIAATVFSSMCVDDGFSKVCLP